VPLPGGDAAVRNPCRTALAYLMAADVRWDDAIPSVSACTGAERAVIARTAGDAAGSGQAIPCSSMGRLFDAVASLIGARHRIGYEAQAAIELEHLALSCQSPPALGTGATADAGSQLPLPVGTDGVIDYRPLIRAIAAAVLGGTPRAVIARAFHVAVAAAVTASAVRVARDRGVTTVGLTGGVFQNVLLTSLCRQRLAAHGFEVLAHQLIPPNDGGIALGQAVIAAGVKAAGLPLAPGPVSPGPVHPSRQGS